MELRDTAKAADGFDLAVTRFPAEGEAWATAQAGRQRIGHFGFFLPESRDNLWRDVVGWFRDKTKPGAGR